MEVMVFCTGRSLHRRLFDLAGLRPALPQATWGVVFCGAVCRYWYLGLSAQAEKATDARVVDPSSERQFLSFA
jgi:hypothetical protein